MNIPERSACFYCHEPFAEGVPKDHPRAKTKDHVIPRSRGGRGVENMVYACFECNNLKSNFTAEEFIAWLAAGRPDKYRFKWTIPHFRDFYIANNAPTPEQVGK